MVENASDWVLSAESRMRTFEIARGRLLRLEVRQAYLGFPLNVGLPGQDEDLDRLLLGPRSSGKAHPRGDQKRPHGELSMIRISNCGLWWAQPFTNGWAPKMKNC